MTIPLVRLGLTALLLPATVGGAAPAEPIAIVYGLTGQVFVTAPPAHTKRRALRFEWLPAATVVEVPPGASLLLAFANGSRFELGGGSAVTLSEPGGFAASKGPVRALPSVSPLPRLESLTAEARLGARAAALRVRGVRIVGLYPRDEASVLPNEAVLSFELLGARPSYRVRVEDESGTTVFEADVATASVAVPPGRLKPGARYHWTVRSLGGSTSARGDADFGTLSPESLAARDALRRSLDPLEDADSLALVAEVDSRLGLLLEAQRGFRAALAKTPADPSLQAALARLEQQLAAAGNDADP